MGIFFHKLLSISRGLIRHGVGLNFRNKKEESTILCLDEHKTHTSQNNENYQHMAGFPKTAINSTENCPVSADELRICWEKNENKKMQNISKKEQQEKKTRHKISNQTAYQLSIWIRQLGEVVQTQNLESDIQHYISFLIAASMQDLTSWVPVIAWQWHRLCFEAMSGTDSALLWWLLTHRLPFKCCRNTVTL